MGHLTLTPSARMNAPLRTSDDSTSASLIRRVQRADRTSWERLSKLYGPVVYQWARHTGLQPQDAADVMQDVFQAVTQNIAQFDHKTSGASFRGWLWTITRNKVRDHHRQLARQAKAAGGTDAYQRLLEMAETPPESESDQGKAERSGVQQRALQLMKTDFEPQTWQAFWKTTIEGQSPSEVAADLGVSKWTVYKARSRVLQRLRDEFAELLD